MDGAAWCHRDVLSIYKQKKKKKNSLTPISTESTATDKLNNTNIGFHQPEIVFSRGQTIRKKHIF